MKQEIDIQSLINRAEARLNYCTKKVEQLSHPEIYGCCLSKCNSIVINKERMMTITTDRNQMPSFEFSPLNPTYFSPETAEYIQKNVVFKDVNGERIPLEIVGELEYYKLMQESLKHNLKIMGSVFG